MKRCLILTGGKLSLAFAGSFLKKSKYEKDFSHQPRFHFHKDRYF